MKKRQVVMYIVVALILMCTSVYATVTGTLGYEVNPKTSLYAGDVFTITLKLSNVDSEDGINTVEGYIDIDENVLEPLTVSSIVTDEDGNVKINDDNILKVYDASDENLSSKEGIIFNSQVTGGDSDYKIVMDFPTEITSTVEQLLTIKFKIKSDVEAGTYNDIIKYKTFTLFSKDAVAKKEVDSQSLSIKVSSKSVTDNNATNNAVNNVASNNTVKNNTTNNVASNNTVKNNTTNNVVSNNTVKNNTTNNVTSNNTVKNNTTNNTVSNNAVKNNTAKNNVVQNNAGTVNNTVDTTKSTTALPNTGYRLILLPVIIIAILGLVFYKKYAKYNKNMD
jgi:hypothetical protein